MSGHSKWKQIKNKKAASDAKKGAVFTRLIRNIILAAREGGGDANGNFKLATAIEQARAVNMPKDNIERAIKKGTGEDAGSELHEVLYEAYGPGGVAILIKAATDNLNRTISDVRHALQKNNGTLASGGAVAWNFAQKGVVRFSEVPANKEELELTAIDAGADDINEEEGGVVITTEIKNLQRLKEELAKKGFKSEYADIEFVPKNTVALDDGGQAKLETLTAAIDDLEDVQDYYTNAE